MSMNPQWIWIALGAIALLIVVGLVSFGARRTRTSSLREKFGSEYDRALHEKGSRVSAESELLARKEQVKGFDIHPLTAAQYSQSVKDWARIEQRFFERPTTAVAEADELVAEIMRMRGYPMGDFEKHAAHLSVTHPRVVEHYRAGHRIITVTPATASTEDLRQAMLHYRALFEELTGGAVAGDIALELPRASEISAPRAETTSAPRRDEDRRPSDTFR